jgi:Undecaprenyl-phosphate glucose phosphotransferase
MLKQHSELFKGLLVTSDLCFVSLAWWSAYVIRFYSGWFASPEPYIPRHYLTAWLLILLTWLGVFEFFGFHRARRLSTYRRETAELLKVSTLALLMFLGLLFLVRELVLSRSVVIMFWLLSLVLLNLGHVMVREGLRRLRRHGYNLRHVLIVGMPIQCLALYRRVRDYRHLGLRVVGLHLLIDDPPADLPADLKLLRSPDEFSAFVRAGGVDQVFVALPLEMSPRLREVQEWLGDEPVALHFVPDLGEMAKLRGNIEEFDGLQIISLQASPLGGWNALLKRAVDLVVGSVAVGVFLPLMAIITFLIKCTSPGAVLYRQERMGLDGDRFVMLKFRTMVNNAEESTGPVWAAEADPRITAVGRWLRQTSLDELPQLFNVLRGEMSLVGPRPERPPLIDEFRRSIPRYMLRHKVKAGMTGWAQIHGWRGNTSLETRVKFDLDYIENWSLTWDLKILALTLLRGFRNYPANIS